MKSLINKILLLSLTLIFIGFFLIFTAIWYFSTDLPDFDFLKNYKPPVSTKVYNSSGEIIADFSRQRRSFIKYEQIPKKIIFHNLTRTSTGKIQKYNLRKIVIENNA